MKSKQTSSHGRQSTCVWRSCWCEGEVFGQGVAGEPPHTHTHLPPAHAHTPTRTHAQQSPHTDRRVSATWVPASGSRKRGLHPGPRALQQDRTVCRLRYLTALLRRCSHQKTHTEESPSDDVGATCTRDSHSSPTKRVPVCSAKQTALQGRSSSLVGLPPPPGVGPWAAAMRLGHAGAAPGT